MDENAIKLIQQTAIAADAGQQERMPAGTIALPSNFEVIDLERYMPGRRRFRGTFTTNVLADFIGYVTANTIEIGDGDAECYVDANNMAATTIFNLVNSNGETGHADWKAKLALEQTAAYAALLGINARPLDQQQLIDFLEDWGSVIAVEGGLGNAVAAIRQIQITQKRESERTIGNFAATDSVLDEVEAKSKQGLPAFFQFSAAPYLGLSSRTFTLQLRILTGSDKPKLTLRINELETTKEAIATEFKEVLFRDLADGKLKIYIGSFSP